MKEIRSSSTPPSVIGVINEIASNGLPEINGSGVPDAGYVGPERSSNLDIRAADERSFLEGGPDYCDEPSISRVDEDCQRAEVPCSQQGPYSISPMRDTSNLCMKSEHPLTIHSSGSRNGDLGVGIKPSFPQKLVCNGVNPRRASRRRKYKLSADDLPTSSDCPDDSFSASDDERKKSRLQPKRTRYFSESPEPSSESNGPEECDASVALDHFSEHPAPTDNFKETVSESAIGDVKDLERCSTSGISLLTELDSHLQLLNSGISFRRVRITLQSPTKNHFSDRKSERRNSYLSNPAPNIGMVATKEDQRSQCSKASAAYSEPELRSRYPLRSQPQLAPNDEATTAADCPPSNSCNGSACNESLPPRPPEKNIKRRLKSKMDYAVTDLDQVSENGQPKLFLSQLCSGIKDAGHCIDMPVESVSQKCVGLAKCDSNKSEHGAVCVDGVTFNAVQEASHCLVQPQVQLDLKAKGVIDVEAAGKDCGIAANLLQLSAQLQKSQSKSENCSDGSGLDKIKPGDHLKPVKLQFCNSSRADKTTYGKNNPSKIAVVNGSTCSKSIRKAASSKAMKQIMIYDDQVGEPTAHDAIGDDQTCENAVCSQQIKSDGLACGLQTGGVGGIAFPSERANSLQVLANAANAALEQERSAKCKSPTNYSTTQQPNEYASESANADRSSPSSDLQGDNSKEILSGILHHFHPSRNIVESIDSVYSRPFNGTAQMSGLLESAGLLHPPASAARQIDPMTGFARTQPHAQFPGITPFNMPFQSGMPFLASSNCSSLLSSSNALGQILAPSLSDNLKALSPALSQRFHFLGNPSTTMGPELLGGSRGAFGQGVPAVHCATAVQGQQLGLPYSSGDLLGGGIRSTPYLHGMSQSSPPQLFHSAFSGNSFLNCMGNTDIFGRNAGDSSMVAAAAQLTAAAALFQVLKSSQRQF
mmetsp:Transcript_83985/g.224685  ORF Transcript_83985/g.224685 Transcript_83985/m.224685 type:complete len:932 (+) Transcript_83985:255-3050(+)|eukprot:CAMPEP_0113683596 /NCGR_PEP_ID=MMETSP0038_2-20120614/13424_1 /TAXON_ID=2898 /ORGANISM="Cryptomonas paramecium" /LENGTH=931 /DNA_ID=CAMNT_0000603029 /DNA_START=182 /DNA_END=2977 /DNA_ORIENTATION=- /assembly_acc=CAM_ASM_000170